MAGGLDYFRAGLTLHLRMKPLTIPRYSHRFRYVSSSAMLTLSGSRC